MPPSSRPEWFIRVIAGEGGDAGILGVVDPTSRHPVELAPWPLAALVGASVLSNTVLIPAARPLLVYLHGPSDGVVHAFMSLNMLGGALGAPLLATIADRTGRRRSVAMAAAALDGVLMLACMLPIPVALLLVLRTMQGAASIGALSVLMGTASGTPGRASAIGMAAAASMAAVALGAPVGTLLLGLHPLAPLAAGAILALAIASALSLVRLSDTPRARRDGLRVLLRRHPLIRLPVAWVTAERFAVGCMVVSFSLYAHRALGLDDARIGALYGWFLFPFVALTYPTARVEGARARAALVTLGLAGYALALGMLGLAPAHALDAVMLLAGVSSAAVYGPSLRYATSLSPSSSRSSTMALLHAGGSIGMLTGTASAGVLASLLGRAGWGPETVYPFVFALAGLAQLAALAVTAPGLRGLVRSGDVATTSESPA